MDYLQIKFNAMPKTIIISNRLPIKIDRINSKLNYKTSEGGLATGLGSIYKTGDNLWLGWPGMVPETDEEISDIDAYLKTEQMRPVFFVRA